MTQDEFAKAHQDLLAKQLALVNAFKEYSDATDAVVAMREKILALFTSPPPANPGSSLQFKAP